MGAGVSMTQGEGERDGEAGAGSAGEPGSGVVVAFGRQLKLLRTQVGLDRVEFGKRTGYAPQSVASFEQGRRIPQPRFIDRADEVLGAGGVLTALKEEVLRAQYPAFPGHGRVGGQSDRPQRVREPRGSGPSSDS
jgi:Helix-turn-helix domain